MLVDSEERRVNHDCVRNKEEENTVTNVIAEIMAAKTDWQILRLSPVPLPDPFIPLSDASLLYEVRKVYLKLSLALHPDRCADPLCEEAFKKVVCARDNILNGKKRPRAPNTSRNSEGGGEGASADEGVQKKENKPKKLTRPQKRKLRSMNKREEELIRRLVSIEKQKEDALHRVRAYELEVSAAKRRGVRIAFHESQIPSLLGKENVRWLDGRWVTADQAVELCLNSSTDEIIQFGEKLRECRKTFLTSHKMSRLSHHLRIPAYSQIKIARLKERKAIFDHDKARKELLSIEDREKLVLREIKLSIDVTNEFLKSCT